MINRNEYKISRSEIKTDHFGVIELLKFYAFAQAKVNCSVNLNLYNVNFMDANLSALIYAICYKLREEQNVRVFLDFDSKTFNVLWRNGLLLHLKGKGDDNPYNDDRNSTIALKTIHTEDDDGFCQYIRKDFFGHRGLEELRSSVRDTLSSHYQEVFCNVQRHRCHSMGYFG